MTDLPQASSFKRDPREGVGAIIGIAGGTGSGKTLTARRVARGLAALPGEDLTDPATLERIDGRIAHIDTERRRALHYQVAAGELPSPFRRGHAACFRFAHAELDPPFTPDAYKRLIVEADEAGFACIIVDSFSHEWEGEGGLMEWHDEVQERMLGEARKRAADRNDGNLPRWWNDAEQRDKLNIGAWKEPKLAHKKLVNRLMRCRAHVIVCMRAEDKLRIESKKEEGRNGREYTKTTITPAADLPPRERWQPICEKRFPFELITSFVMTPDQPGVPIPLKMHEDHRAFLREGQVLDEEFGRRVAAWARGQTDQARPAPSSRGDPGEAGGREARPASPPSPPAGPMDGDATPPSGRDWPNDDGFPGDRSPPGSDQPPPDAVWLGALWFDPREPVALPTSESMAKSDWQLLVKAFRELTERAPSTQTARAWRQANQETLLRLKAVSPPAHASALEFCPPEADAA